MPEDNNTSNNSNQGVAWYVKPTSDTIDFAKGIPVNVLADPDNVKVFDNTALFWTTKTLCQTLLL